MQLPQYRKCWASRLNCSVHTTSTHSFRTAMTTQPGRRPNNTYAHKNSRCFPQWQLAASPQSQQLPPHKHSVASERKGQGGLATHQPNPYQQDRTAQFGCEHLTRAVHTHPSTPQRMVTQQHKKPSAHNYSCLKTQDACCAAAGNRCPKSTSLCLKPLDTTPWTNTTATPASHKRASCICEG